MRTDKDKLKMMADEIKKILPENFEIFPTDSFFVFQKRGRSHQVYLRYNPKSLFTAPDYCRQAQDKFRNLT